jgi:hypothetical protein
MTAKRAKANPAQNMPSPSFIVDTILPSQQLHIIGGPAHAGKTTLVFRIMDDWRAGLNVFGFKANPVPFCYVSCVSSIESCQDVASRMGISGIDMISAVDEGNVKCFDDVYTLAIKKVPDLQVIFLDSILRIADSSGLDNKIVGDFLSGLLRKLKEYKVTVVATGRCAKPKENRSTVRSIDRFLGATAWTEFASTFVAIEPKRPNSPHDDRRVVTVMPKNAAAITLQYRFTSDGKLVEVSEDMAADSADRVQSLKEMIDAYGQGGEIHTSELLELGGAIGIVARSSMMRYIAIMVRRGELIDAGHGKYQIPMVQ